MAIPTRCVCPVGGPATIRPKFYLSLTAGTAWKVVRAYWVYLYPGLLPGFGRNIPTPTLCPLRPVKRDLAFALISSSQGEVVR